jgi:hypothetical protein
MNTIFLFYCFFFGGGGSLTDVVQYYCRDYKMFPCAFPSFSCSVWALDLAPISRIATHTATVKHMYNNRFDPAQLCAVRYTNTGQ